MGSKNSTTKGDIKLVRIDTFSAKSTQRETKEAREQGRLVQNTDDAIRIHKEGGVGIIVQPDLPAASALFKIACRDIRKLGYTVNGE